MGREILLKAHGVSKSFGAVRVLHDVTFDVHRGEVLGILGPNGAGKTTLFNVISGDLKTSGGEIQLGDTALRGEPPFRRCQMGIGRTYQIPRPYSGMTTFENLLVGGAGGGGGGGGPPAGGGGGRGGGGGGAPPPPPGGAPP
ncbi:ATP-binding cassette domain-containing protein, partial [Mesorhizobium ciceri]|uniref:ATP-binding cassette domain-containing protein n=1 Tax=Mesorhizobium ciceri TaxID=39645 RepID=UPI00344FE7D0